MGDLQHLLVHFDSTVLGEKWNMDGILVTPKILALFEEEELALQALRLANACAFALSSCAHSGDEQRAAKLCQGFEVPQRKRRAQPCGHVLEIVRCFWKDCCRASCFWWMLSMFLPECVHRQGWPVSMMWRQDGCWDVFNMRKIMTQSGWHEHNHEESSHSSSRMFNHMFY